MRKNQLKREEDIVLLGMIIISFIETIETNWVDLKKVNNELSASKLSHVRASIRLSLRNMVS